MDSKVWVVLVIPFLLDLRIEIRLSLSFSLCTQLLFRHEGMVVGILGVVTDPSLIEYREHVA